MKLLLNKNLTCDEFLEWLDEQRDEDGRVQKLLMRKCTVTDIPDKEFVSLLSWFDTLDIHNSVIKHCNFVTK